MKKLFCLLLAVLMLAGCSGTEVPPETTTQPTTTAAPTETTEPTVVPDKLIALTFDDGPNVNNSMEDVLDILKQYDVKATFFLIGQQIDNSTKDVVLRAHQEGHELGSHSFSHLNMKDMTEAEIQQEYQKVQDLVKTVTGEEPKLFRPPFLAASELMRQTIPAPFINGLGASDYEAGVTAETIAARTLRNAQDGAIILLHVSKGYDWTEDSLHIIIPELKKQGYEFVTVSELFARTGVTPENGVSYEIIGQTAE